MTQKNTVKFTIDGRPFTVFDSEQASGDLLQLADLDPCGYDLARLCANSEPEKFEDDAQITVKPGDRFVAIRQSAAVA